MSRAITFTAAQDIPSLGLTVGDVLIWEPGHECPMAIHREIPEDHARVIGALAMGSLKPLLSMPIPEIVALLLECMNMPAPPTWRPPLATDSSEPAPIDVDAALASLKQKPRNVPVEPAASCILHGDALGRHFEWWQARQRVRRCSSCHQDFEVRDRRVKRCDSCRSARGTGQQQGEPHGQA